MRITTKFCQNSETKIRNFKDVSDFQRYLQYIYYFFALRGLIRYCAFILFQEKSRPVRRKCFQSGEKSLLKVSKSQKEIVMYPQSPYSKKPTKFCTFICPSLLKVVKIKQSIYFILLNITNQCKKVCLFYLSLVRFICII